MTLESAPARKSKETILQFVARHAADLSQMTTHHQMREWALAAGLDSPSGFAAFKRALAAIGLDYDALKAGVIAVASAARAEAAAELPALTLYSDAASSEGRFAICGADRQPVWYGRFFDGEDSSQAAAEFDAAEKAIWLAGKVRESLGGEQLALELFVDAQHLTIASGDSFRRLQTAARRAGVVLTLTHVPGAENPSDKWSRVKSGFQKCNPGEIARSLRPEAAAPAAAESPAAPAEKYAPPADLPKNSAGEPIGWSRLSSASIIGRNATGIHIRGSVDRAGRLPGPHSFWAAAWRVIEVGGSVYLHPAEEEKVNASLPRGSYALMADTVRTDAELAKEAARRAAWQAEAEAKAAAEAERIATARAAQEHLTGPRRYRNSRGQWLFGLKLGGEFSQVKPVPFWTEDEALALCDAGEALANLGILSDLGIEQIPGGQPTICHSQHPGKAYVCRPTPFRKGGIADLRRLSDEAILPDAIKNL